MTDPRVRAAEAVEKERDLPEEIMTNCLFVQPSLTQAGRTGRGRGRNGYAVCCIPLTARNANAETGSTATLPSSAAVVKYSV